MAVKLNKPMLQDLKRYQKPGSDQSTRVSIGEAKLLISRGVREIENSVLQGDPKKKVREKTTGVINTLKAAVEHADSGLTRLRLTNALEVRFPVLVERALKNDIPGDAEPFDTGYSGFPDQANPHILAKDLMDIAYARPLADDLGSLFETPGSRGKMNPSFKGLLKKSTLQEIHRELPMVYDNLTDKHADAAQFFNLQELFDLGGERLGFAIDFRIGNEVTGGRVYISEDQSNISCGIS